jgi:hypothetical protein
VGKARRNGDGGEDAEEPEPAKKGRVSFFFSLLPPPVRNRTAWYLKFHIY